MESFQVSLTWCTSKGSSRRTSLKIRAKDIGAAMDKAADKIRREPSRDYAGKMDCAAVPLTN